MKLNNLRAKWLGEVESRGDVNNLLQQPGDTVMVHRGYPRILALLCPCGCKDTIIVNLDMQAGPAWKLYRKKDNVDDFTLFPSIWREAGCKSHFILWHGEFIRLGYKPSIGIPRSTLEQVKANLTRNSKHYLDIAEVLYENPWTVLWACEELIHEGIAKGNSKDGLFSLK